MGDRSADRAEWEEELTLHRPPLSAAHMGPRPAHQNKNNPVSSKVRRQQQQPEGFGRGERGGGSSSSANGGDMSTMMDADDDDAPSYISGSDGPVPRSPGTVVAAAGAAAGSSLSTKGHGRGQNDGELRVERGELSALTSPEPQHRRADREEHGVGKTRGESEQSSPCSSPSSGHRPRHPLSPRPSTAPLESPERRTTVTRRHREGPGTQTLADALPQAVVADGWPGGPGQNRAGLHRPKHGREESGGGDNGSRSIRGDEGRGGEGVTDQQERAGRETPEAENGSTRVPAFGMCIWTRLRDAPAAPKIAKLRPMPVDDGQTGPDHDGDLDHGIDAMDDDEDEKESARTTSQRDGRVRSGGTKSGEERLGKRPDDRTSVDRSSTPSSPSSASSLTSKKRRLSALGADQDDQSVRQSGAPIGDVGEGSRVGKGTDADDVNGERDGKRRLVQQSRPVPAEDQVNGRLYVGSSSPRLFCVPVTLSCRVALLFPLPSVLFRD